MMLITANWWHRLRQRNHQILKLLGARTHDFGTWTGNFSLAVVNHLCAGSSTPAPGGYTAAGRGLASPLYRHRAFQSLPAPRREEKGAKGRVRSARSPCPRTAAQPFPGGPPAEGGSAGETRTRETRGGAQAALRDPPGRAAAGHGGLRAPRVTPATLERRRCPARPPPPAGHYLAPAAAGPAPGPERRPRAAQLLRAWQWRRPRSPSPLRAHWLRRFMWPNKTLLDTALCVPPGRGTGNAARRVGEVARGACRDGERPQGGLEKEGPGRAAPAAAARPPPRHRRPGPATYRGAGGCGRAAVPHQVGGGRHVPDAAGWGRAARSATRR